MSAAVSAFQSKRDGILGKTSRDMAATRAGVVETMHETRVSSEATIVNKRTVLAALEGTDLTTRILSHQVAANTVHARELASLQLKYATKTRELDEAHSVHETLRQSANVLRVEGEDAADASGLRTQYNQLVEKIVASRAMHRMRVDEVREAQAIESGSLRRERDALQKSLDEVEATYDASVRTLESQLLLLLRSKLEAKYREQLDSQKQRVSALSQRRDEQARNLATLQVEYERLLRQLEDQQTAHAAHVAAAAREALARQRGELDRALDDLRRDHERARNALLEELTALRLAHEAEQRRHERALSDLRATHEADLASRREAHAHELRMCAEARDADGKRDVDNLKRELHDAADRRKRDHLAAKDLMKQLEAQIHGFALELEKLNRAAPKRRAELERRHEDELARMRAEREKAADAAERRRRRELDEAAHKAAQEARDKGRRQADALLVKEDPRATGEADRLRRMIAAAKQRAQAAKVQQREQLSALQKAHGKAMASVSMDDDGGRVMAGVDDVGDMRAMAAARRAELVRADKQAACDELRTDCASYADALAALQRALGAERAAHGAEVRRQQAELDAKESELALLRAEKASYVVVESETETGSAFTRTKTVELSAEGSNYAREGAALLDTAVSAGDDPVMAEWRKLVQAEKTSRRATTAPPPPAVVDLDATNARAASLAKELEELTNQLVVPTNPTVKAQLEAKKFTIQAEMRMLKRMQQVGAS